MSLLWSDNFDSYADDPTAPTGLYSAYPPWGGTLDNMQIGIGGIGKCVQVPAGGSTYQGFYKDFSATSQVVIGADFKFSVNPLSAMGSPLYFFTGYSGEIFLLGVTSTGALKFYNDATASYPLITAAGVIVDNTWHRIEMSFDMNGSGAGALIVRVDGAVVGSISGLVTYTGLSRLYLGTSYYIQTRPTVQIDNLFIRNDLSFLNPFSSGSGGSGGSSSAKSRFMQIVG